jgi:hypothetical protein
MAMGITEWLTIEQPEIGSTVVDRAWVNLYGLRTATMAKVTRVTPEGQTLSGQPLAMLEIEFTNSDGETESDLAWSDETYTVATAS